MEHPPCCMRSWTGCPYDFLSGTQKANPCLKNPPPLHPAPPPKVNPCLPSRIPNGSTGTIKDKGEVEEAKAVADTVATRTAVVTATEAVAVAAITRDRGRRADIAMITPTSLSSRPVCRMWEPERARAKPRWNYPPAVR